jgi:predicted translin family RNA/ssDNA-binding protein
MLNKKFIQQLKKDHDARTGERRQIISRSNSALNDAKRIIFSLHRGDLERATALLADVEKNLAELEKKFGYTRIKEEGAYGAAVEEYVEAKMFYRVLKGEKIDKIAKLKIGIEGYIGGICDLTGELVRRAVNCAAKGELDEVAKINGIINDIMAELVEFDISGYLRTKYDQARTNLRKIEQVAYEISMRKE